MPTLAELAATARQQWLGGTRSTATQEPPPSEPKAAPRRLTDIIAQLESGGGRYAGQQPETMADKTYGQYPGFAKQYGSGAAGVENYARQFLAANPKATLGDFYANYVLDTGDPRKPKYSFDDLKTTTVKGAAGAHANLIKNAGVPADTPLSSLMTGTLYGAAGPITNGPSAAVIQAGMARPG
jgi:hypothetical protein